MVGQAFARHGTPEIVNTDQGSQFTATEFTKAVLNRSCKLSMDGRGVKYERVYPRSYDSVNNARADKGTVLLRAYSF